MVQRLRAFEDRGDLPVVGASVVDHHLAQKELFGERADIRFDLTFAKRQGIVLFAKLVVAAFDLFDELVGRHHFARGDIAARLRPGDDAVIGTGERAFSRFDFLGDDVFVPLVEILLSRLLDVGDRLHDDRRVDIRFLKQVQTVLVLADQPVSDLGGLFLHVVERQPAGQLDVMRLLRLVGRNRLSAMLHPKPDPDQGQNNQKRHHQDEIKEPVQERAEEKVTSAPHRRRGLAQERIVERLDPRFRVGVRTARLGVYGGISVSHHVLPPEMLLIKYKNPFSLNYISPFFFFKQ